MTPAPASLPIIDSRYQVVRLLGQGGMGAVYECRHVGTRRSFAVKVILAEAMGKPQALERFLREAAAAGSIKSPHVVDVADVGLDRTTGNAFMAMELLSGHDLAKEIEDHGKLAPDLVLRIAVQALAGLCAAHAAGVVHRDMKPANLFLARATGDELVVKLLDFGIAKVQGGGDIQQAKLTKTGVVFGSPSYMSPEQASGAANIDQRTDIWSFGAVMYEALTGSPPYSDASSLQDLIMRIWAGPPPPLSVIAPYVPVAIADVVARAMTHAAGERYQTAEEMLAAVKALVPVAATITSTELGKGGAPSAPLPVTSVDIASGTPSLLQGGPSAPKSPSPAPSPSMGRGTQPMAPPTSAATQGAFGATVAPARPRRLAVYGVATVAVTVLLSAAALRLIPKPAESGAPGGGSHDPDASATGTTTTTADVPPLNGSPGGAAESADAGAPPDSGVDAGSEGPDAGAGAAPAGAGSAKTPAKAGPQSPGKPGSVFSNERRKI